MNLEQDSETDRHVLFADLLRWARRNLQRTLSIRELAEHCALSKRRFLMSFLENVGETPAKAIERLRVEAAIELITTTDELMADIARKVGFVNPERMRRAFLRSFGRAPHQMKIALRERGADQLGAVIQEN